MERRFKITLYVIALCISIATIANVVYNRSPKHSVDLQATLKTVSQYEKKAKVELDRLTQIIEKNGIDSLYRLKIEKNNSFNFYVYTNGILEYWSSNTIPLNDLIFDENKKVQYIQTANAHCLAFTQKTNDDLILALLPIKYIFPYENDKLKNEFNHIFDIDNSVEVNVNQGVDSYKITDSNQNYLFSLVSDTKTYNNRAGAISFLFSCISVLLLLFVYANYPKILGKKQLNPLSFATSAFVTGVIVASSLYFNLPTMLYWNEVFSAFQYASNPFLASISHLSFISFFLLANAYLLFSYVKTKTDNKYFFIAYFGFFSLLFVTFYNILSGLVFHSSIELNIFSLQDINFVSIWLHFLIFIWGMSLVLIATKVSDTLGSNTNKFAIIVVISSIGLIFATTTILGYSFRLSLVFACTLLLLFALQKLRKHFHYKYLVYLLAAIFAVAITQNTSTLSKEKKADKYKIIAQNILVNGNTENDRMAEILIEELDVQIMNELLNNPERIHPDSILVLNQYFNKKYLRGFWSKYEMRLLIGKVEDAFYYNYKKYVDVSAMKIKNTHFYSVASNYENMAYVGLFTTAADPKYAVAFEFYQRKNFKSYSFPNLFSSETPDLQEKLNINVVIYENQMISYRSRPNSSEIELSYDELPKSKKDFFVFQKQGADYYLYQSKNNRLVISENNVPKKSDKIIYISYVALFFLALSSLTLWHFGKKTGQNYPKIGFTRKFQYLFISLLIISFVSIFFVSINYFKLKNEKLQLDNIQQKKRYIQKALQDMYYWTQDLTQIDRQAMNLDLQELSYIYETDIHVYDNYGLLVGSSQPLLFSKNLLSNLIAPLPYFGDNSDIYQYEKIGDLQYLNAYTDFVNGDYMQIGFIAVPQFLSEEMNRSEIESFIATIVHIYLVITILVIILSLIIGQQLSAPLNLVSQKLKQMNYGKRNEKIDYRLRDEIGELVEQYNKTIDALEESAIKLAQTERETAWKTMARQIAHEINNPLTPMKLTIQQLQRTKQMNDERFDDYFDKSTKTLIEQINNLSRIAGTFSNFARMPEAQFSNFDIAEKLHLTVTLFANNNENTSIKYHGLQKNVYVVADAEQIIQVFNNLLKNALQSIPIEKDGRIDVTLEVIDELTDDRRIKVTIADNGMGMSEEVQHKLFSPNFSTKSTGMGLGLSITKNIVEASGGKISYKTELGVGTSFVIELK